MSCPDHEICYCECHGGGVLHCMPCCGTCERCGLDGVCDPEQRCSEHDEHCEGRAYPRRRIVDGKLAWVKVCNHHNQKATEALIALAAKALPDRLPTSSRSFTNEELEAIAEYEASVDDMGRPYKKEEPDKKLWLPEDGL